MKTSALALLAAATCALAVPVADPFPDADFDNAAGSVKFAGVNIAGFDFGCGTDGTCNTAKAVNPTSVGTQQMQHFVRDDGLNAFRLPVGWQYLLDNKLGGNLGSGAQAYDALVQACLSAGSKLCIIDIHNYARWNGQIIGQGGPTNEQFASVWSQLATKYKSHSQIAFGIMNEPHDLNVQEWAVSVQAAVTAIRNAGANNRILLSGTQYTSGAAFISDGSAAALLTVKNPDGGHKNLIFDVHQYLDSDNSGTHSNCVNNNVASFNTLATWLRQNKRKAMLTETGGGPTDSSCLQLVCQELAAIKQNGDVFLGWTGWSAGAFATTYTLSLVPNGNTDVPLLTQCFAGEFK